jgi:hypothetical protein
MAISEAMKHLLEAAKQLSEEIRHEPTTPPRMHMGYVKPLHLLAAALSDEISEVAEVLKQADSATGERNDPTRGFFLAFRGTRRRLHSLACLRLRSGCGPTPILC